MSSEVSFPIRTAQLLGITTSVVYSGSVFYQYLLVVPSYISLPPKEGISRWYRMHILSKNNLAPAALVGIFSYAFLALQHYTKPATYLSIGGARLVKWKAYASATVLMMAFIPWTAKVMLPINYLLEDYHDGKKELADREANALLVEWRRRSVVRAFPAGAAVLIGTLAAFCIMMELMELSLKWELLVFLVNIRDAEASATLLQSRFICTDSLTQ